jgi:hypothetical protein
LPFDLPRNSRHSLLNLERDLEDFHIQLSESLISISSFNVRLTPNPYNTFTVISSNCLPCSATEPNLCMQLKYPS